MTATRTPPKPVPRSNRRVRAAVAAVAAAAVAAVRAVAGNSKEEQIHEENDNADRVRPSGVSAPVWPRRLRQ